MASPRARISLTPRPNGQENPPKPPLESQLQQIPRDTTSLAIEDETPSDADWALLSSHFTSIKDLTLSSGFNEYLNDNIPLHWPLERLVLNSATGELCRTPWITEGKLKHLRLEYTMELRFEGPSNEELVKMQKERIARGEEEEVKTERGMKIIYLPELVQKCFAEKYSSNEPQKRELEPDELDSDIETLEIIENDVHDVLVRLCLSTPRVFSNLKTLHLRATNGCDFYYAEDVLCQILPQLTTLKTLIMTLGSEYSEPKNLTQLYLHFPPNLETLRFRSTVQLAQSNTWSEWVEAFEKPEFLPQLRRLSFLLDLQQKEGTLLHFARKKQREKDQGGSVQQPESQEPANEKYKVSTEDLRAAKRACEQIWTAATKRGITVEPFSEKCPGGSPDQKPLDDRWEGL